MKDFSRLLDEPGTDLLEANLLRLARSEGPSGENRRRILAGLGVAVTASALSSSSAASSAAFKSSAGSAWGRTAVNAHSALKWGIFGTLVVGAGALAMLIGHRAPKAQSTAAASPAVVAPSPVLLPKPAVVPATAVDSTQVTKLEDLPTLPDNTASEGSHAAAPSLADEVAAIKSAKNALAAGRPAQSLRELDAYRVHFPRGRLSQEASVVRIEALLKSGNQAAGTAAADRFLAAHADSPYASRVHTLIGY